MTMYAEKRCYYWFAVNMLHDVLWADSGCLTSYPCGQTAYNAMKICCWHLMDDRCSTSMCLTFMYKYVYSIRFTSADAEKPDGGVYLVFHGDGYTTYEAEHCYTTHSVDKHATDFVMHMKGGSIRQFGLHWLRTSHYLYYMFYVIKQHLFESMLHK